MNSKKCSRLGSSPKSGRIIGRKNQSEISISQGWRIHSSIIGWRDICVEFIGLRMPELCRDENFFGHERKLPEWFWTGRQKEMPEPLDYPILEQAYASTIPAADGYRKFYAFGRNWSRWNRSNWVPRNLHRSIEWVESPIHGAWASFCRWRKLVAPNPMSPRQLHQKAG